MLKKYRLPNGRTYQFEESEAPASAVPVEPAIMQAEVPKKAKKPANKARKAATK